MYKVIFSYDVEGADEHVYLTPSRDEAENVADFVRGIVDEGDMVSSTIYFYEDGVLLKEI